MSFLRHKGSSTLAITGCVLNSCRREVSASSRGVGMSACITQFYPFSRATGPKL